MTRWLSLVLVVVATTVRAGEPTLAALLDDGSLVVFRPGDAASVRAPTPKGVSTKLIGIDRRPADGRLYGIAGGTDVYTIDPTTGEATLISTLTVPFDGDVRSGVDFTPQLDRLRLVSADGRNLRVNVALGATAVDTPLAYASGDPHAGTRPHVTAAGYANNRPGVATTTLFEIDYELDVLVIQDPANDGVLKTVGPLGVDFGPVAGLDIVTDGEGTDRAYAASGTTLYTVDLKTGRATAVGSVPGARRAVVSLAAIDDGSAP
ncbi:MAG: DUF4394 domain-containing protein [Candidatus Binatia bacterium]